MTPRDVHREKLREFSFITCCLYVCQLPQKYTIFPFRFSSRLTAAHFPGGMYIMKNIFLLRIHDSTWSLIMLPVVFHTSLLMCAYDEIHLSFTLSFLLSLSHFVVKSMSNKHFETVGKCFSIIKGKFTFHIQQTLKRENKIFSSLFPSLLHNIKVI